MKRHVMQAAVIEAPNRCRIDDVAIPEPGASEVRVRLEGCGICGSNLAPWEGRPWFQYPMAPGELGHEGWGRVDAVGKNVKSVREGERVSLLSYRAYAEYDVAPEMAIVRLPEALDGAPFPGEALGCAMNVFHRSGIEQGNCVAIIGIGFLGAVLTALSVNAGAKVIAISRRHYALDMAKKLGACTTILFETNQISQIVEAVREFTHGKGCDRVIEAAGVQSALDLAAELTCERGRLIIAGYHQDGKRQVNMQLWNWRGLDVINAHERNPNVYRRGIEGAVNAVANKQLNPLPLYTHRFNLAHLADGLDAMKNRKDGFLKGWVACGS
jgi:threonine dehydrogenase-like Zn-dependent dehydrogenase